MLCSTMLSRTIIPKHIRKIVGPVIVTAVVFLALASSDRSAIFLITDIVISKETG